MFPKNMGLEVAFKARLVRAVRTGEGPLPRMSHVVPLQHDLVQTQPTAHWTQVALARGFAVLYTQLAEGHRCR